MPRLPSVRSLTSALYELATPEVTDLELRFERLSHTLTAEYVPFWVPEHQAFEWDINMCAHERYNWDSIRIRHTKRYRAACDEVNELYRLHCSIFMESIHEFADEAATVLYPMIRAGVIRSYVRERRILCLRKFRDDRMHDSSMPAAVLRILGDYEVEYGSNPSAAILSQIAIQPKVQRQMTLRSVQLWFTRRRALTASIVAEPVDPCISSLLPFADAIDRDFPTLTITAITTESKEPETVVVAP
jgi:hypothetical protein